MMSDPAFFEHHSRPIDERLAAGLYKLGLAVKHHERLQAQDDGLSPTQAQILSLLALEGPKTGSDAAHALGVSLPTVSDSVRVLLDKGLVARAPDATHPRAMVLTLTRSGRAQAQRAAAWPEFLAVSLGMLTDAQQASLLSILLTLLRGLQESGQIPVQRMCLTCTHFRPHAHPGPRPHHCALVDAPMRPSHLRLECGEHDPAPADEQSERWQRFLARAV